MPQAHALLRWEERMGFLYFHGECGGGLMAALAPAVEGPGALLYVVEGELVALVVYLVAVDDVVYLAKDALEDEVPVVLEKFYLFGKLLLKGNKDRLFFIRCYLLFQDYLFSDLEAPCCLVRGGLVRYILELDRVGRQVPAYQLLDDILFIIFRVYRLVHLESFYGVTGLSSRL